MEDIKITLNGDEEKIYTIDELNKLVDPATRMAMTKDIEDKIKKDLKINENKILTEG